MPLFAEEIQWRLVNGTGERIPPDILQVTGDGTGTAVWRSEPVALQPSGYYRFSVSHRGIDTSGGCLPCGIEGFSRDYSTVSNQWTEESFYFRPIGINNPPALLRVGHWESTGTFQFRKAKLEPIVPIWREFELPFGVIWLGEGETVRNGKFSFRSNFGGKGTNTQLTFDNVTATFNSNRWNFGGNSFLEHRFVLGNLPAPFIRFTDGKLIINVCYHTRGEGIIEVASDQDWIKLARITKVGTLEIILPDNFFPREGIFVRIRGLADCYFQVDRIDIEASLPETYEGTDLHSLNLRGETLFAVMDKDNPPHNPPHEHLFFLTQNNEIKIIELLYPTPEPVVTLRDAKVIPLKKSRSPGEIETTFEFEGVTYTLTTQTHR